MQTSARSDREVIIRVEDLSFRFNDHLVLDRVEFTVYKGEALVVMGESGCGKTTLLKILCGLLKAETGRVEILGRDLDEMDEDRLDDFRMNIGMLFQFGALINSFTVGENVLLALQRHRMIDRMLAERVARFKLSLVGLEDVFDVRPAELSGGMKKRAGLARALVLDPDLLFFDEPTSGLDPVTAAGMDRLILDLKKLLDTTIVVVTHDLKSAFAIGDRIVMLDEGRVVAGGTEQALRASSDPAVKRFIDRNEPKHKAEPDSRLASLFSEDQ